MVPFAALRELAAHEQQFLARVRKHRAEVRTQVGELLPVVAGHAAEQRAFAVHDLVVRQRQHEVLVERIHEPERHLVVVVLAVNRVLAHVAERVVHPAHVPLECESETARIDGPGDAGPRRRLFRVGRGAVRVNRRIQALQEFDGLEVLAAAELVRQPLAGLARIIEIQHRCDRVDADTVDVKLVDPVQRAADQVVDDFAAAEIEYQRAPVDVLTPSRILVLVERGAVEARQAVLVLREVCRHPVDDHADAVFMESVDEIAKLVGRAETLRRREHADRLVSPGAVERVFRHGQQLDVGEPHVGDVLHEIVGELAVAQVAVALGGVAAPRAQVHFVDRHGPCKLRGRVAPPHPRLVAPFVVAVENDRRVARRPLVKAAERIGLQRQALAVLVEQLVLVLGAVADAGHEDLPDAVRRVQPHDVRAAVPAVEIRDDADPRRVRCPHGEAHARDALDGAQVGAEFPVNRGVRAFTEQVQVEIAKCRRKAVAVVDRVPLAVVRRNTQPVYALARRHVGHVQALGKHALHVRHEPVVGVDEIDALRARLERAHDAARAALVYAEQRKRIAVAALDERL